MPEWALARQQALLPQRARLARLVHGHAHWSSLLMCCTWWGLRRTTKKGAMRVRARRQARTTWSFLRRMQMGCLGAESIFALVRTSRTGRTTGHRASSVRSLALRIELIECGSPLLTGGRTHCRYVQADLLCRQKGAVRARRSSWGDIETWESGHRVDTWLDNVFGSRKKQTFVLLLSLYHTWLLIFKLIAVMVRSQSNKWDQKAQIFWITKNIDLKKRENRYFKDLIILYWN